MDPFIEGFEWPPFHVAFMTTIARALVPILPDGYAIAPETGVTAPDLILGEKKAYRPGIGIQETPHSSARPTETTNYTISPPTATFILPETPQRTLTIRTVGNRELVTAIEILSPSNKKGGGLAQYAAKRSELLRNQVNLVEIDLLRGGTIPQPAIGYPDGTYRIQVVDGVSKTTRYWAIGLADRLPTIAVPLLTGDVELPLDLQAVFQETYYYNTYSRLLAYEMDQLRPPVSDEEKAVLQEYLQG